MGRAKQYTHAWLHPRYGLIVCRKGIWLSGGTVLMMVRALTWRNSMPP